MNGSLQPQPPSSVSRTPVTKTTRDDGRKILRPMNAMSRPNAALRAGSPDRLASTANTWAVAAPPSQTIAATMWRKSQSSYDVISLPVAPDPVEQPADRDVHEPDDDGGPDVRPEPVDREVGGDPLGEREHEDVEREVREAERDDDQRQSEDREDRLQDRVADREHERPQQQRIPPSNRHAAEHPVDDDQRQDVDAPKDEESDEKRHRRFTPS